MSFGFALILEALMGRQIDVEKNSEILIKRKIKGIVHNFFIFGQISYLPDPGVSGVRSMGPGVSNRTL